MGPLCRRRGKLQSPNRSPGGRPDDTIRHVRALPLTITLVASLLLYRSADAPATPGFAEWEITTPGGHLISHIDPLKSRYGTCLRKPDATPGLVYDRPEDVYVAHIEWWAYHRDHVSGKARACLRTAHPRGRLARGVAPAPPRALPAVRDRESRHAGGRRADAAPDRRPLPGARSVNPVPARATASLSIPGMHARA